MKLLGKIIVILLAALMVAGGTLALETSGALSSLTGGGPGGWGGRAPDDFAGAFVPGERPARGDFGGAGDREGGWASGLLSMARNLGVITAVIAAVVGGAALLGWLAGQAATRRKLAKAPLPPQEKAPPEEKM